VQAVLDDYVAGSTVATDLVNTAPEVMVSTGDALADPDALLAFLTQHDLHPDALAGGRPPSRADVTAVHAVRRALRGVLEAADAAEAAARASAVAVAAGSGPALLQGADGRWRWYVRSRDGAALCDELALLTATGLLSVLRVLGHDRFRQCASPACAGMFVDTSRSGRRRYCVPEVCGNRINVANHRARRRAAIHE
jgi:predicted RNA-binding Zn ribbon-like protein